MDADPFELMAAEAGRLDRFYATLAPHEWRAPTRCAGWDRKDLLAHLIGIEDYTRACLDDRVTDYANQAGNVGYERLNDVLVERRRATPAEELLTEWRTKAADNLRRLRERGAQAQLATSVGAYPLGRQAYYLACELAIHADDAGVPVTDGERAGRLRWRAQFGLDALGEVRPGAKVATGDGYRVEVDGVDATLSEYNFVEATSSRLPPDAPVPPAVRRALRVLA